MADDDERELSDRGAARGGVICIVIICLVVAAYCYVLTSDSFRDVMTPHGTPIDGSVTPAPFRKQILVCSRTDPLGHPYLHNAEQCYYER